MTDHTLTLDLHRVAERHRESVTAHVVVRDGDEFVGDFAVTYTYDAHWGAYRTDDFDDVRAAGGLYTEADPATGLLRDAADRVAADLDADVCHCFR